MAGFYGRTGIEFKDTLTDGLAQLALKVGPAAEAAVAEAGELIRGLAYINANVSPGILGNGAGGEHMRDEIKVEVRRMDNGVSARIGIDMSIIPYAAHQEFGPHGNRFLSRAIDEGRQEAHQIMRMVFSASIKDGKFSTQVRMRNIA